jgi:GAF domain-containing protein
MAEQPDIDLAYRMAELARQVAAPSSVEHVLATVTATVLELIPRTDAAGVLLITKGGKFETHAGTSELPRRLDRLQEEFREGPCYTAAVDALIVRTDDFRAETRWPRYSPRVVDIGVLSGLSFKLYTSDNTAGALNLFSFQADAFDSESEAMGSVLAAHAAAAIIASRRGEQLQSALTTRDLIGQAKGVIMERYHVDAVRAFELLRQLSQTSNTKLIDVAQRIVEDSQALSPGE